MESSYPIDAQSYPKLFFVAMVRLAPTSQDKAPEFRIASCLLGLALPRPLRRSANGIKTIPNANTTISSCSILGYYAREQLGGER
jgi:hypothetical protein